MSTLSVSQAPAKRRRFSPDFKARIVAACQQPDTSVSRIALDNGLNTNMVRRWIREAEGRSRTASGFLPVSLPAAPTAAHHTSSPGTIRIEVPHTGGPVIIEWPADQASQCLAWLRELLR